MREAEEHERHWEQTDEQLALAARSGDGEAFGELVRRHRAKAFGIAKSYAGDAHLAEDIVQEALIRAYLQLGTLADPSLFAPWLNRIVRNQAYSKLRRGGPWRNERPLAAFAMTGDDAADDDRLARLVQDAEPAGDRAGRDIADLLEQREANETMTRLLDALKPAERMLFEAYIAEVPAASLAAERGISTDAVYQAVSRARVKLREARFRMEVSEIIRGEGASVPGSVMLAWKRGYDQQDGEQPAYQSFGHAVHHALRMTGASAYSLTDVMGLTGEAFRLHVETSRIDASGPTTYFWEPVFHQALRNIGCRGIHTGDGGLPPSAYALGHGLRHMRRALAAGRPVIAWDVSGPSFSLIVGYDDAAMQAEVLTGRRAKALAYDRIGRHTAGGLFILSIDETVQLPYEASLRMALHQIIRHAHGERGFLGYACGLMGYEAWSRAFREGRVDGVGNAYTAAAAAEARRHAPAFLLDAAERLTGSAASCARRAASHYEDAAACMRRLAELFPFPAGGNAADPVHRDQAIWLLNEAGKAERDGIRQLEMLLERLPAPT